MKRKVWIATVYIAVFAEEESEACDAISLSLTENLMGPGPVGSGAIVDWQYATEGSLPVYKGECSDNEIEECEVFEDI